jgi:chromosome segregation ATPase
MGGLSFLTSKNAVPGAAGQRGPNEGLKRDLLGNLSRDLDRVRDERDALALKRDTIASNVTALTTQIAELETRIAEEKDRRERERVASEIEGIKKRFEDTAAAFALAIAKFCDATEAAATLVPEARELNRLLLSVATEVDIAIVSLSRELQRQTEGVSEGHAALDLSRSVNEASQRSKSDEGIGSAQQCEYAVGGPPSDSDLRRCAPSRR